MNFIVLVSNFNSGPWFAKGPFEELGEALSHATTWVTDGPWDFAKVMRLTEEGVEVERGDTNNGD